MLTFVNKYINLKKPNKQANNQKPKTIKDLIQRLVFF